MYRLDYSDNFWNSWRSSLAKHCVILSSIVAFSYVCSPLSLAQTTHPFANTSFEGNYKKLQKNFQQLLSGVTLRLAIEQVGNANGLLIWLDRRVDGEQTVNVQIQDGTVKDSIDALLRQTGLHLTWVGSIPYVCRKEDSAAIELAYWNIATAGNGQLVSQSAVPWSWEKPEHPRELFERFVNQAHLEVNNANLIKHDYWAAREIPQLDVATNLALILAGFNLTMHRVDNAWLIVPVNTANADVAFGYDEKLVQGIERKKFADWQLRWNDKSQWRTQQKKRWLKAPVMAHRELYISTLNLPESKPPAAPANEAASLKRIEQRRFETHLAGRLVDILPKIFNQLSLNWSASELTKELGERKIDVQAKNFTVDELLKAIGDNAGCIITRRKLTVSIQSK